MRIVTRFLEIPLKDGINEDEYMLKAISNPHRVKIMSILREKPSSIGNISKALGITKQLARHHMNVLTSMGLVSESDAGTIKIYALTAMGQDIIDRFRLSGQTIAQERPTLRLNLIKVLPVASALTIFAFALLRFLSTPDAKPSWLLGAGISAIIAYLILRKIISKLVRNYG